jgi:hypothetical protein
MRRIPIDDVVDRDLRAISVTGVSLDEVAIGGLAERG